MNAIEQSKDFCLNYLSCLKKVASQLNVTYSQAICINYIPRKGISQVDLAKKLSIDISTLSRNLEHLIHLQLIHKTNSTLDKRSYKISLSDKGKQFYKLFNESIEKRLQIIYSSIDIDEKEQLVDILNKINWQFELYEK